MLLQVELSREEEHSTLPVGDNNVAARKSDNHQDKNKEKSYGKSSSGNGGRGGNGNGGRKKRNGALRPRYEEHLSREEIERQLKIGAIVEGILHINQYNRREAYVKRNVKIGTNDVAITALEQLDISASMDILIEGEVNRNRAFDGDRVVVSILDQSQWKQRIKRDTNSETQRVLLQPTGRVVALKSIVERRRRLFAGYLRSMRDNGPILPTDKNLMFIPMDMKVPRMLIPVDRVLPEELQCDDPQAHAQEYFAVRFTRWTCASVLPMGQIVRHIGRSGNLDTEIKCIEIDNNVGTDSLTESNMEEELRRFENWTIPQEEFQNRRDLRLTHRVFTIDPENSKDLDDAISIRKLSLSSSFCRTDRKRLLYEIGIHIADVSYFVEHGSSLDLEARLRSTSVYLANKIIPMLPTIVSEQLCSLNAGVDRLALSLLVIVDERGEIVDAEDYHEGPTVWMGRTIVRSCAKLSYDLVQSVIEGNITVAHHATNACLHAKCDSERFKALVKDLHQLHAITSNMHHTRLAHGSLHLGQPKLRFQFDGSSDPIAIYSEEHTSSRVLVEELMLLSNRLVARKLISTPELRDCALLRSHPKPSFRQREELIEFCKQHGIGLTLDSTVIEIGHTARQLEEENPVLACVYNHQIIKMLSQARYLCTGTYASATESSDVDHMQGNKWHHFALNTPFYTHFTSPIRRYADLMVHRQLLWALDREQLSGNRSAFLSTEYIEAIVEHCNKRQVEAKRAEEQSINAALLTMLNNRIEQGKPPMEIDAIVLGSSNKSLAVYIPVLDMEQRVYLDKNLKNQCGQIKHDKDSQSLLISWKYVPEKCRSDRSLEYFNAVHIDWTLRPLDRVRVELSVKTEQINPWRDLKVNLIKPPPPDDLDQRPIIPVPSTVLDA